MALGKILCGEPRRMQRDGHAVAGKRRRASRLVAKPPKSIGVTLYEAIGDRADRQRARPARLRAIETPPQMRAAFQQRCEQSWPALSADKRPPANQQTKICDIVPYRFQS